MEMVHVTKNIYACKSQKRSHDKRITERCTEFQFTPGDSRLTAANPVPLRLVQFNNSNSIVPAAAFKVKNDIDHNHLRQFHFKKSNFFSDL